MAKPTYRRKQYFVLVRFQLKYIAYILLFLYLGALVAGYTVYWTTWVTLGEKLANVYPRSRLIYIFKAANWTLLWRIILITPAFLVIGTFLSHRIAGPIYRIRKYIDTLISGDYSRTLSLRKKDELKDLANKLSELCTDLQARSDKRKQSLDELLQLLQQKNVDPALLSEITEKVKSVQV